MQWQRQWLLLLIFGDVQLDVDSQQALRGIPAGKLIARMLHQEGQLLIAVRIIQLHRRRELAQQGRYRLVRHAVEHESLLRFGNVQDVIDR
ncbi:hypothetical protein D3C75_928350 [compost metagenome]